MRSWFRQLDELLRGQRTGPDLLAGGQVDLKLRVFVPLALLLGAAYGFFMGWFGVVGREQAVYIQLLASSIKLPALFLLTLLVTFPSLYVFNALVGCRLNFTATLRLLVAAICVNLAVVASLGPILGFFTLSTTSYAFMVLLNVLLCTVGGLVGLGFLLHTLRRLAVPMMPPPPPMPPVREPGMTPTSSRPGEAEGLIGPLPAKLRPPGPLDVPSGGYSPEALGIAGSIFRVWVIIYALVGAQMGWLLRPFIGNPGQPFTWFRPRGGNFFEAVAQQIKNLFEIRY